MEKLQRIGVSLEDGLLSRFDGLIEGQGYLNRSEAIRDLIRERLDAEKLENPHSRAVAGVFVVYDHHQSDLAQKLINIQHGHVVKTISSMHVHLGRKDCLEVILLRGKVSEIKKLADSIISLKGVRLGKVNLINTE